MNGSNVLDFGEVDLALASSPGGAFEDLQDDQEFERTLRLLDHAVGKDAADISAEREARKPRPMPRRFEGRVARMFDAVH